MGTPFLEESPKTAAPQCVPMTRVLMSLIRIKPHWRGRPECGGRRP
jgi:hypothetical protein